MAEGGSITVRTERLLLRALVEADRGEFIRMHTASRAHFAPWAPAPEAGTTLDDVFNEQLARVANDEKAGTGLRRAGFLADGRMAGMFTLDQIYRGVFQNCYCGWRIGVECIGRGLATEAVWGMLDAAFAAAPLGLGLHRVQANVIPRNLPSLRVAEKCGFRREGLAKEYLKIAGAWEDHVTLAKLAEEHEVRSELTR